MAIQTINLTVPGGDTPRSANTKINANFSDQSNAASRLLGSGEQNKLTLNQDLFVSAHSSVTLTPGVGMATQDLNTFLVGRGAIETTKAPNAMPAAWTSLYTIIEAKRTSNGSYQMGYATDKSEIFYRVNLSAASGGGAWSSWARFYSTANTTKDANGFIKAASPIVKVFADKVELNGEAVDQDVSYKKNGVGDYTITTVSGLSTDGWYIELPKDMNGNPKVAVTLSEVEGVISLKTYKRIFSMETFTFEPDLDNPLDIPDTRWIDLRLNEILVEEVNP